MNPNKPSPPPDDFESKITALLLGELAVKKSYGSLFLETLPKTRRSVKEENLILRDVENFFFS